MREKIRNFMDTHPVAFHLIFMVLYCGIYMFYHGAIQPDPNYTWDISFLRLAIVLATILFIREIYQNRFRLGFNTKNSKKSFVLLWPLMLFGLLSFLQNFGILFSGLPIVWYSFFMIVFRYAVTGLYEEVGIRGVLVCHMMRVNRNKKHCILYATLMSSFLFGIVHINNILREGPSAILQCFYAFAIGVVFAAAYLRTRTLWVSIILHAIFDVIGSTVNLFMVPGGPVPSYQGSAIEQFLNTGMGFFIGAAIMTVICIVAGLYMIRSSKHDEIMMLWKDEIEENAKSDEVLSPVSIS